MHRSGCRVLLLGVMLGLGARGTAQADSPYVVYRNSQDPVQSYFAPGAGEILSDDMCLAVAEGCTMDSYSLLVYAYSGELFDVYVDLWADDPCADTPSLIEGTAAVFLDLPPSAETPHLLTATFDPPIHIPGTLYMRARFSTDQVGWIIANRAETGSTLDQFWLEEPQQDRCAYYWWCCGGDPYAGFWASITCGILADFDGDGSVDLDDVPGFVAALLGLDPVHRGRAHMNGDGAADGQDVRLFFNALLDV
ncbi:MAG TPA: hypothetical protein VMV94_18515 [Phycisphaerae bacterium]|nr:hypothetical protein [Phycisphaerae bacterium]